MKRIMKRAVALLVCLTMLAALSLSAAAVTTGISPIIYIADMEDIDLYEYPDTLRQSVVLDQDSDAFRSACIKMLSALVSTDDNGAASATPAVTAGIDSILSPIACSPSGQSRNPAVGALQYTLPLSQYPGDEINTAVITAIADAVASKVNRNFFYVFLYDWRLDPTENANALRQYIDNVLASSRASSVSLIAAGYGGVVANAYLYKYRAQAAQRIYSCVFLDSPLMGNALIGDLMKGKAVKKAEDNNSIASTINTISGEERGEAMLRYLNDDPNNFLYSLTQSILGESLGGQILGVFAKYLLLEVLESEGSASKIAKLYNNFMLLEGSKVYEAGLKEYLRTMPGLWALVPTKDYNAAMGFLYGDEILDYNFARRLSNAREVTDNTVSTLKRAKADGIKTYVVANYGRQILPATISIDDLSDGVESTKYASAGAVTKECGKEWVVQINCVGVNHNHRSPDNDIEASTCALPESTWFIKDLKHMDFQYKTTAEFVAFLVTSTTQRTVWDTEEYPQYLVYSKYRKNISPYSSNEGAAGDYILGDTDLDGAVTPADARTVLRYSVELETPTKMMRIVADVDGDGAIMPEDARLVLRYSVGLISTFPAAGA